MMDFEWRPSVETVLRCISTFNSYSSLWKINLPWPSPLSSSQSLSPSLTILLQWRHLHCGRWTCPAPASTHPAKPQSTWWLKKMPFYLLTYCQHLSMHSMQKILVRKIETFKNISNWFLWVFSKWFNIKHHLFPATLLWLMKKYSWKIR